METVQNSLLVHMTRKRTQSCVLVIKDTQTLEQRKTCFVKVRQSHSEISRVILYLLYVDYR